MTTPVHNAIARICDGQGVVFGTGFLADREHVVTCAHVVNDALGRPWDALDKPDLAVFIDLPVAGIHGVSATVVEWHQPREGRELEIEPVADIAILRLQKKAPSSLRP